MDFEPFRSQSNPCPKCASSRLYFATSLPYGIQKALVYCGDCGHDRPGASVNWDAIANADSMREAAGAAVERWNTRP